MRRLLVPLLLMLISPSVASAQTIVGTADSSGNGVTDTWVIDDNDDGIIDRVVVDLDNDGYFEAYGLTTADGNELQTVYLNTNGSAIFNGAIVRHFGNTGLGISSLGFSYYVDNDENGKWEVAYYDGQNDGIFELICVDTTGDGACDLWQYNTAPAGQDQAAASARHFAAGAYVRALAAANVPIFGPTTIPLP